MDNNDRDLTNDNYQTDLAKTKFSQDMNKMIEKQAKILKSLGPTIEILRKASKEYSPVFNALKDFSKMIRQQYQYIERNGASPFYDRIHQASLKNTSYGWCMSAHISISAYRKIAESEDSQEEKDRLFVMEFEAENFDLYEAEKNQIIMTAHQEWRAFYEECFYLIDHQRYQAVVPSFISAIEHELLFEQTSAYGTRLIRRVETSFENQDQTSFLYALSTSVLNLLKSNIFLNHQFDEDRPR